MKTINQSAKKKMSSSSKIIFFIILIAITIFTYISTKKPTPKKQNNSFSALYSGDTKSDGSEQPAKLRWSDSFKGINNMGNK